MKIYGETTQEGEPTPESPKEIKNEAFIYCVDKNGNKVMDRELCSKQVLQEYKSYILFNQKTMTEAEYWKEKYWRLLYYE